MAALRVFDLEPIRTDGWFDRLSKTVASFQALCDIVGERFFAFSMITGARITALTVDRRVPANTLVDFVSGTPGEESSPSAESERLTLKMFRERLVSSLVTQELKSTAPKKSSEVQKLQQHIGVRSLLLAPLFGYKVERLECNDEHSEIIVDHAGIEERFALDEFRQVLYSCVRRELEHANAEQDSGLIDLKQVALAEQAAKTGDHKRVVQMLRSWATPLTIFLRTPEGQRLGHDTRTLICKALVLLATSLVAEHESTLAEDVLRLGIQYAQGTRLGADMYSQLGAILLRDGRAGEAIGLLRRAASLGGEPSKIWPPLGQALLERRRYLAALAAVYEGERQGVESRLLDTVRSQAEVALGTPLEAWKAVVRPTG